MKKIVVFGLLIFSSLSAMENGNNAFDPIEEESIEDIFGPRSDLFSDEELSDTEDSRGIKRPRDESLETEKSAKQKIMTTEELASFLQQQTGSVGLMEGEDALSLEEQLWSAAETGDVDKVKSLLGQGVSVNAQDEEGLTALYFAIANKHPEMIDFLLKSGANIYIEDKDGETLLDFASNEYFGERNEAPLYLMIKYKKLNQEDLNNLFISINRLCLKEEALFFLKNGAEINPQKAEELPLFGALLSCPCQSNGGMVKFLLDHGANANLKYDFRTELITAIRRVAIYEEFGDEKPCYINILLLLDYGADISLQGRELLYDQPMSAIEFANSVGLQNLAKFFEAYEKYLQAFLEQPIGFKGAMLTIDDKNSYAINENSLASHIYYGLPYDKNKQMFKQLGKAYIKEDKKELFTDLFKDFYFKDKSQERRKAYEDLQNELLHFKITQGKQTTLFGAFKTPDIKFRFKDSK